jgi:fluoride ion exporter CrcB/FEX
MNEGRLVRALSYVATNNICSIAAAGFGMMVVKKILGAKA